MKLILRTLLFVMIFVMLAACGNNENTYDFDELQMSLPSSEEEEVQLFSGNGKALYVYFTGIQ